MHFALGGGTMWAAKHRKGNGHMIYDTLLHVDAYRGVHPRLYRALELLRDTDFSKIPDGTYEVEGKELFYFLQTYETKEENSTPEAHKLYADIMLMLSGEEVIGVAPLEWVTDTGDRPEGDIRFYRGETVPILLKKDRFAVFLPGDAHAPGIALGEPKTVRKCVFKVRLD